MKKLYIDTNILVYGSEDTKNIYGKNISISSSHLLFEAISCKYQLIISSWTLEELKKINKLQQVKTLFQLIKPKIIKVFHTKEDIQRAKQRNPYNYQDELHKILAEKSKADYIINRNIKDFKNTKIKAIPPEFLLQSHNFK